MRPLYEHFVYDLFDEKHRRKEYSIDEILALMVDGEEIREIYVNPYGLCPCFISQEYAIRIIEAFNELD